MWLGREESSGFGHTEKVLQFGIHGSEFVLTQNRVPSLHLIIFSQQSYLQLHLLCHQREVLAGVPVLSACLMATGPSGEGGLWVRHGGLRQVTYFQASFFSMGSVRNRSMSSNCSVLHKSFYFGSVWKMLLRSGSSAKGYTHT